MTDVAEDHTKEQSSLYSELLVVATSVFLFVLVEKLIDRSNDVGGWANIALVGFSAGICLALRGPKASVVSQPTNIIIRVIAIMLGIYVLVSPLSFPSGESAYADSLLIASRVAAFVSVTFSFFSIRYPTFVIVPCVSVLASKAIGTDLFDIGISPTDYIPIVEIGLFLGVGLCLLTPQRTRLQFKFGRFFAMADASKTSTLLFMVAVGIHFANYFYSGMAKVLLDGGPILWVMQNPTDVLALNAYVGGFLPSTFLFAGQASGAKTLEALRPLINYSILLAQLGAIIFILRKRSMILATLFYDITHVVIYLVSGIFFWKWIILNIGLVLAMRKLPRWIETPKPMILGVAAIVLSPYAFHIARLGWYDTPALVVSEVYAVTADGKQVRVPSNFFGTVSVTVAQHRLGRTNPGHYPTVTWGTTQNAEVFDKAIKDCSYSADEVWQFKTTPNKIIRIVQYSHAYALQQVADGSTFHYNWFPHHIWSYPLSYRDFDTVALTDIDYYLYRTTSFCVHLGLNGPEIEEVTSDEFQIPLHPDAQSKTGL